MSFIKLKQISGPTGESNNGATIVFENNTPKWTSSNTGALLLPSGDTTARPTGINGHIRYNTETNRADFYLDGSWIDVGPMVGATSLLDGKGGLLPSPVAGQEDRFLRGDGTWQLAPIGFREYTFKINFLSGNINSTTPFQDYNLYDGTVGSTETDWTFTYLSANKFRVSHPLGLDPIMCVFAGYKSASGFTQKIPTGNAPAFSAVYNTETVNSVVKNNITYDGISAGNTNADAAGYAIVKMLFSV